MTKTVLKEHQAQCIDKTLKHFKAGGETFRINMVTGSGKTITAIHLIERLYLDFPELKCLPLAVSCHTLNLKEQLESDLNEEKRRGLDTVAPWGEFHTYQGLRSKSVSDFGGDRLGVLLIDESHQGGLSQAEDSSYAQIIRELRPKFLISLSATDSGLNEELFGAKLYENSYRYTYEDAYEDGLLNECEHVVMHSGLLLEINSLRDNSVEIKKTKNTAEAEVHLERKGLLRGRGDAHEKLSNAALQTAVRVYFEKEWNGTLSLKPAVFFCRTVDEAKRGADSFYKVYRKELRAKKLKPTGIESVVRAVHSMNNEVDADLLAFREKLYPIIFNVRMLQEGFNAPWLSLGFDLAPSLSNEGRSYFQKLGRLLRREEGKEISRFYSIARPSRSTAKFNSELVLDLWQSRSEDMASLPAGIQELLASEDKNLRLMAEQALAQYLSAAKELSEARDKSIATQDLMGEWERLRGSKEHLDSVEAKSKDDVILMRWQFKLSAASGEKEEGRVNLSELVREKVTGDQRKEEVIAFCLKHGRLPNASSEDEMEALLYRSIRRYCNAAQTYYDPHFEKHVRGYGYGIKQDTASPKKAAIIEYVTANGKKPSVKDPDPEVRKLAVSMFSYTHAGSKAYDASFREKLESLTVSVSYAGRRNKSIAALKEFIREHRRVPSRESSDEKERKLYVKHSMYISEKKKTHDETYRDWVFSFISKQERRVMNKGAFKKKIIRSSSDISLPI
ncbi:MAG: hypothetical protein EOP06_03970, partial [Proteobacteria bacterium]